MTSDTLAIDCLPDGTLSFVWSDDLADLAQHGTASIVRVSEVEPDASGRWWANLSRIGGPMLGPFVKRGEAIAAELEWLRNRS